MDERLPPRCAAGRRSHGETLRYLFWGLMTTAVNYLSFYGGIRLWGERQVLLVNALSFVLATGFAFFANKCFVFDSPSWERRVWLREAIPFLGARLLSFGLEELGLLLSLVWLAAKPWTLWGLDGILWCKLLLSLFVVLLNYVIAKRLIFLPKGG